MINFDANIYSNRPNYPILEDKDPDDNFLNEVYSELYADTVPKHYTIDRFNWL